MNTATPRRFSVTWDYRCPFARNAHEHVVAGLRGGAAWEVTFVPFSLGQVHVAEGEPPVWDRPGDDTGLLALQAGVAVRDHQPDRFLDAHVALFALRHDQGRKLKEPDDVRSALTSVGVDADAVFEGISSGEPLATVRAEHEASVRDHGTWGVPTFAAGDQAGFVRLMPAPARTSTPGAAPSTACSTCSSGPTSTSSSTPRSLADADVRSGSPGTLGLRAG